MGLLHFTSPVAQGGSSFEVTNDAGNPLPVNGTVTITDGSGPVTVDGAVTADPTRPSSGAPVQVASSATNVTLKASNASRKGLSLFNDSTQYLYVKKGAAATLTSYSYKVPPGALLELPAPVYTGILDGIWAAANGNAYVSEDV